MPSTGTSKIPRFKIIFSMCECCCPFFIFCLFLAFQRKVRNLTTQKSLTTMHLVNFYKWFQSTTLSDHLSFFCLLGWDQRGTKNRTMVRTFVPKCLLGDKILILFSTLKPYFVDLMKTSKFNFICDEKTFFVQKLILNR